MVIIFLEQVIVKKSTRIESDSVGALEIPQEAYYGVQALRGYKNFQISGVKMHPAFIKNIVLIKKAAAMTNGAEGMMVE